MARKTSVSSFPVDTGTVTGMMNGRTADRWPGYQLSGSLSFEEFTSSFGKHCRSMAWLSVILFFVLWEVHFVLWEALEPDPCLMYLSAAVILVSHRRSSWSASKVHGACVCVFLLLFTCSWPTAVYVAPSVALTEGAAVILPSVSGADPSLELPLNRFTKQSLWSHMPGSHFLPFWYLGKLQLLF